MATDSNVNAKSERGFCYWCVKTFKWIPVLFILTIFLWSYYAYVVQLCFIKIESNIQKVIYLILYHFFFVMFFWSYWQTIFADVGTVPAKFKVPPSEIDKLMLAENEEVQKRILEQFAKNLPNINTTMSGGVRFCDKCQHIKPDRAHHCSVCGTCILKMDHHCPWVNNCVCFFNYKFFILFLGYALLYCVFISLTSLKYFIRFWQGELVGMGKFHILFLFFVALMFAVSLVSLFGYHCYLVCHNRTTLEAFRAPVFRTGADKNGFNLGYYNNFQEVFGNSPKLWFLPVFTSLGDGVIFPVQPQHQASVYNSMGSTHNSEVAQTDIVEYPVTEATSLTQHALGRSTAVPVEC